MRPKAVKWLIIIDRVHRLPNKQQENNTRLSQPRTVIARLKSVSERNFILKNSYKLKNTGIFINDDVCEGTIKARREKIDDLREAKKNGKIAYFIGRRLVVHERIKPRVHQSSTPPRRRSNVSSLIEAYSPNVAPVNSSPGSSKVDVTQLQDVGENQAIALMQSQNKKVLRPPSNV